MCTDTVVVVHVDTCRDDAASVWYFDIRAHWNITASVGRVDGRAYRDDAASVGRVDGRAFRDDTVSVSFGPSFNLLT